MTQEGGPAEHAPLISAIWWRATHYEVRDGLIQPAADATIEPYDPWAAYEHGRSGWGGGGAPPPYAALLELVWRVRLLPPRDQQPARLTPGSEALVLAWCTAHGLLGIPLQEAEAVYYAARWGNAQVSSDGEYEGVLQPIRISYVWGSTPWNIAGWAERKEPWSLPADPLLRVPFDNEEEVYEGDVVPPECVSERWRPEVLVRVPPDGPYATRPLGPTWGPFFPRVAPAKRSTYRYPWPGSERWWGEYAEPVARFLEAANLLSEALLYLEPGRDPDEPWPVKHLGLPTRGQVLLHGLLQGVRPMLFRPRDSGWIGGWRAKSLLATYAMMAYLDLVDGKRILTCDVCEKPYVTGAYQARYCSERCRNTAVKRAYRQRKSQRGASDGGVPE